MDPPELGAACNCLQREVLLSGCEVPFCPVGSIRLFPGKSLDLYVKRFYEKTLDYYDAADKETMVDICLHDMVNEYCVLVEILSFPSFFKLMEAARWTDEYQKMTPKPSLVSCPSLVARKFSRKRPIVAIVEKSPEAMPSNWKKPPYRREHR